MPRYPLDNAADVSTQSQARKFLHGLGSGDTPIRITDSPATEDGSPRATTRLQAASGVTLPGAITHAIVVPVKSVVAAVLSVNPVDLHLELGDVGRRQVGPVGTITKASIAESAGPTAIPLAAAVRDRRCPGTELCASLPALEAHALSG